MLLLLSSPIDKISIHDDDSFCASATAALNAGSPYKPPLIGLKEKDGIHLLYLEISHCLPVIKPRNGISGSESPHAQFLIPHCTMQ